MTRAFFFLTLMYSCLFAAESFQVKNYSYLIGMKGFNQSLLEMHFKLYEGYVKNTNLLQEKLKQLSLDQKEYGPEYAGLKHMLSWEYDGMRLHEYYFENLGGKTPIDLNTALIKGITENFGSFDAWKADFIATGMMRGIGWVILYRDTKTKQLINCWINEHNLGHLAGNTPILVMDVFEHAYITQYGLDRKSYIEAFFDNINWDIVTKRYE